MSQQRADLGQSEKALQEGLGKLGDQTPGGMGGAAVPKIGADPESLSKLAGLKLRAMRVVEGFLSGLHKSPHRGASVEFAEYKEYSPGDDVRHIDWRAYGKSDKYYVKQFEEETNLRGFLALDTSGSMTFGSHDLTKLEVGQIIVATLAQLLIAQGDGAGVLTFDEAPHPLLRPAAKRSQLDDIVRVLESVKPGDTSTNIQRALRRLTEGAKSRSLIVIVSDFLDVELLEPAEEELPAEPTIPKEIGDLLGVLQSRKMDVMVIHLFDPAEVSLPYEGLAQFEGLEGDGMLIVEPDDIREVYAEAIQRHFLNVETMCTRNRVDYHRVSTDEPLDQVMLRIFQNRLRRRR